MRLIIQKHYSNQEKWLRPNVRWLMDSVILDQARRVRRAAYTGTELPK